MATDPERFNEQFSELTNALQQAVVLSRRRAIEARQDVEAADALHTAVQRAVAAAEELRPNSDGEQS